MELLTRNLKSLLISARPDGKFDIGIQLTEDKVLKVDEAFSEEVRDKITQWAPQITAIQKQWGEKADLQNYDGYGRDLVAAKRLRSVCYFPHLQKRILGEAWRITRSSS